MVLNLVAEGYSLLELWPPGDMSSATPSIKSDRKDRGWGGSTRDWIQPVCSCNLRLQKGLQISHRAGKCNRVLPGSASHRGQRHQCMHNYSGFIMKDAFFL